MNPLALVKIFAPLIMDKVIKEKVNTKPTVVGGERIKPEYEEKLVINTKKSSGLAGLIVAVLMAIAMNQGWLTADQADVIDDVLEDKLEQVLENQQVL